MPGAVNIIPGAPIESRDLPELSAFPTLTTEETINLLQSTKSGSPLDPCPPKNFHLLQELFALHLTPIFNQMFSSGIFPASWKLASVHPLLKKPNLDGADPNN